MAAPGCTPTLIVSSKPEDAVSRPRRSIPKIAEQLVRPPRLILSIYTMTQNKMGDP
jgi:hypothetical protein